MHLASPTTGVGGGCPARVGTIEILYTFNHPHIETIIDRFTCARIDPPPARCTALVEDG